MNRLEGEREVILIAGGYIRCQRCAARSKRTRHRCGAPAVRGKEVCRFHGGFSTGPRTTEGKARIAARLLKHGQRTREGDRQRKAAFTRIRVLAILANTTGVLE